MPPVRHQRQASLPTLLPVLRLYQQIGHRPGYSEPAYYTMKYGKQDAGGSGAGKKIYARNRRARFDYRIIETMECGLVLAGWEVKSIRAGKANLSGSYIHFRSGGAYLLGMQIVPLESTDTTAGSIDPERTRRLLMKKAQIRKLARAVHNSGYACVPLDLYQGRSGYLKVSVALGQGSKRADKRERIKERDWERNRARALKRASRQGS